MSIPVSISSGSFGQQSQIQQAQRSADQASQEAQSLQAQAREARADADRAQEEARALELKSGQAQATATQANLNVQTVTSSNIIQTSASDIYSVLPKVVALDNLALTQTPASSTVTANKGQTVGSKINTIA